MKFREGKRSRDVTLTGRAAPPGAGRDVRAAGASSGTRDHSSPLGTAPNIKKLCVIPRQNNNQPLYHRAKDEIISFSKDQFSDSHFVTKTARLPQARKRGSHDTVPHSFPTSGLVHSQRFLTKTSTNKTELTSSIWRSCALRVCFVASLLLPLNRGTVKRNPIPGFDKDQAKRLENRVSRKGQVKY